MWILYIYKLKLNYIKITSATFCIKVSEYAFKENKNTLKIIQVLLYTHFYNTSLNVLRPNFLHICNLPISHFPNIRKIIVKVGPKTDYFSYFMSSCTDRIAVFNNFFFSLIFSQPRDKQNRARNFLLFKYFLNSLLLTFNFHAKYALKACRIIAIKNE